MSDFTYQPAFSAQVEHEPRVMAAKFGDGYEQRVGDGINVDLEAWNLTFVRSATVISAIESQLQGYAGVTAFTWTPSGGSQIKVVCRKWTRSKISRGVDSLTTTFERVLG